MGLLPAKDKCDGLVANYFDTFERTFRILHRPSFTTAYERFWQTEERQRVLSHDHESLVYQIAMVVAVSAAATCSATAIHSFSDSATPLIDVMSRRKCAQLCALTTTWLDRLSGRSRIQFVNLQTRTLVLLAKMLLQLRWDELWEESGKLYRAALKMGLHKEPSTFPQVSPFEAELRRRLFATIIELDILASTAAGLPCDGTMQSFDVRGPSLADDVDLQPAMDEAPLCTEPCAQPQGELARTRSARLRLYSSLPTKNCFDEVDELLQSTRVIDQTIEDLIRASRPEPEIAAVVLNWALVVVALQRAVLHYARPVALYACAHSPDIIIKARTVSNEASLALLRCGAAMNTLDAQSRAIFGILTRGDLLVATLHVCAEVDEGSIQHIQRPLTLLNPSATPASAHTSVGTMKDLLRIHRTRLLQRPLETGLDAREMLWLVMVISDSLSKDHDRGAMHRAILDVMTSCKEQMTSGPSIPKDKVGSSLSRSAMEWDSDSDPFCLEDDDNGISTSPIITMDDILNFDFSFLEEWTVGASPGDILATASP